MYKTDSRTQSDNENRRSRSQNVAHNSARTNQETQKQLDVQHGSSDHAAHNSTTNLSIGKLISPPPPVLTRLALRHQPGPYMSAFRLWFPLLASCSEAERQCRRERRDGCQPSRGTRLEGRTTVDPR